MKTKNIGVKLDINDYLPQKSNININNYNHTKRTFKIGEGVVSGALHYGGLAMLGGAGVGAIVSGLDGMNSVKAQCDAIQDLYNQINNANEVFKKESKTKVNIKTNIDMVKQTITDTIGDVQKNIDTEVQLSKKKYKQTQIITMIVISMFIILISNTNNC